METIVKNISVNKASSYGRYAINGNVNGKWLWVITTDSTIYDNRHSDNCNTEEEMLAHKEAMESCAKLLSAKYETIK